MQPTVPLPSLPSEWRAWNIWLIGWALLLSLCWLIPNHSLPWLSFHSDLWAAVALLLVMPVLLMRGRLGLRWHWGHTLVLLLALLPMAQYACGLIVQFGTAWMASAYLLGLLYAMVLGGYWENQKAGQAIAAVMLAFAVASILSAGIQLYQWLDLDYLGIWALGANNGRPSANLGQPNQLASLLLLGTLAIIWAYEQRALGGWLASLAACFIVTGVALTGSRTAWLAGVLLTACLWFWKRLWRSRRLPWVAGALLAYLVIVAFLHPYLQHLILDGSGSYTLELQHSLRAGAELRPAGWAMFGHAICLQPWFGYGWAQAAFAQAEVATLYPDLGVVFSSAHNVLIDMLVFCGIPIGVTLISAVFYWLYRQVRAIQNAENALVFLVFIVLLNHALLELPLFYGYFLWPLGLLAGVSSQRVSAAWPVVFQKWVGLGIWLLCIFIMVMTARDYFAVEDEFQATRLNAASVDNPRTPELTRYHFLTQWDDYFKYGKVIPWGKMTTNDIAHLEHVVLMWPSPQLFNKLAMSLASHHRPQEASLWLRRMCAMSAPAECAGVVAYWKSGLNHSANFSKVQLPSVPEHLP